MKDYVVVLGGCSLDLTYYQLENGEYPTSASVMAFGGKGANQAVAASRAGASVYMISRLGKEDDISKKIIKNLKDNKVNTKYIDFDKSVSNDVSKVYVSKNGDNEIVRQSGAIDSFNIDMVKNNEKLISKAKFVIAQMKAPKDVSVCLIETCHKAGVPIVVTPCRPKRLLYSENKDLIDKITYITANEKECKTMFETEDIEKCLKMLPNKLIVTLGGRGLMFNDGKKTVTLPAIHTENVVDTTGAGDTLCGNFVANMISGMPLEKALRRAMVASTIKIQSKTAQNGMPTKAELDAYISTHTQMTL